jgi:hypothetical protein
MAGETQAEDLPGPLASADPTPDLGYDELWRLQNDFYGRWISPNNIKEAESINSTLFAENASRASWSATIVVHTRLDLMDLEASNH